MQMKAVILLLCVMVVAAVSGCEPEVEAPAPEPAPPEMPEEAPPVEPEEEPEPEDEAFDMAAAEEVFKESCTACHGLDRIEHHAEVGLEEEPWDVIVTRMIEDMGAQISPEDQQIVLRYLEEKYTE